MKQKSFIISRTFEANRERVWKAWTDLEELKHWWGPKGAVITSCKLDLHAGGLFHYCMKYAGNEIWGKFVYREITKPERIVLVSSFSDEEGGLTRHPFSASWPIEMLTSCAFTEKDGKTTVTIEWTPLNPTNEEQDTFDKGHASMNTGWTGTFDQFAQYLSEQAPFVIERIFDAPISRVWKAITDKDEMKQWYFDLPQFKPEVGTEFQFTGCKDKKHFLHHCKVTEVILGKKITYSWRYEGYEGVSHVTFELFEAGSKTKLRLTHAGLETFPKSEPDLDKKNFAEGWTHIIGTSLKDFLAGIPQGDRHD